MMDVAGALLLQNAWRAGGSGSGGDEGAAVTGATAGETVVNAATIDQLNRLHTMRDEVGRQPPSAFRVSFLPWGTTQTVLLCKLANQKMVVVSWL